VNPDGTHTIVFGPDVILCRLETAASLAGGSLHTPWRKYWVAEWQERRVVIAPEEAFDPSRAARKRRSASSCSSD